MPRGSGASPLEGVSVLDLSRVLAGPYATQLLGDMGADVWKIERPGAGDETRAWGPPFIAGESAYFLSVNRNKKSAALDFGDSAHRAALLAAAREADIVVENFLPGDLERHGLGAAQLRALNPDLVVCSITGYGQDGPYAHLPGYDAVLQGFTGLMSITGLADGPPCKVGVAVVDVLTGAHAAAAILGALAGRLRGRGGAHIDVALFEVGVASLVNVTQAALATGEPARRHGNAHPQIVPYQTFEASDGLLVVAVGNDAQWQRMCAALDLNGLARDERYAGNAGRVLHREEVVGALAACFRGGRRAEWLARLGAAHVPAGPVREVHEVIADPALDARGMIHRGAGAGGADLMGAPFMADGRRPALRLPPPSLGEHTREFLGRFG
jgi:crotonobetainyl-CoA:carnitine CoA-transferase CaiB-like acyl-CoA transferase